MKKINYILLFACAGLLLFSSCHEEWTGEQYKRLVSFKAPLNDDGVTAIYVRYKGTESTQYQLPVIVSGSTTNDQNLTVKVAVDPDTLATLNIEQFQSRTELFFEELGSEYFTMPETVNINAGEDIGLLNIDFTLDDIDLVDKWMLPLTIVDDASGSYVVNPRKNYKKALLQIMPFNDYSGIYSGTALKTYFKGYENDPAIVKSEITVNVVDDNSVFFYAGTIDEKNTDRAKYKIKATFDKESRKVSLTSDNPDINLQVNGIALFSIEEEMDATRPYLLHRYITITGINYYFTDYTSVPGTPIDFTVTGSMILERKINTQIPDEDQAIEW